MPASGWTVSQIVKQVHGRTENRAANKPNFDVRMEFYLGLDEFCQEKHYWWRRRVASFQTVIGQQSYDLGSSTGPIAADAEEIEEAYVINADPTIYGNPVLPAFSARDILAALYGNSAVVSLLPKSAYFLTPGTFQQWSFAKPPDQVYTVGFTYWAVPMVTDTGTDAIPLVPPFLHWGLVYMLERRVYEYLYGQNDPRWQVSNSRYEEFKKSAARSKQFSSQQAIESRMQRPSVVAWGGRGYRGGYDSQTRG